MSNMTEYIHLKIYPEKNSEYFSFYYCYTQNSTFEDLLDFILYNFPKKNFCPCYSFTPRYKDKSSSDPINKNCKLYDYVKKEKITSYEINKNSNNAECNHSSSIKYYQKSKSQLVADILDLDKHYKQQIENLSSQLISLNGRIEDKKKSLKEDLEKEYESTISKLKKENEILIQSINGDIEKINQLKNLGIVNDNLKEKDNVLKINPDSKSNCNK